MCPTSYAYPELWDEAMLVRLVGHGRPSGKETAWLDVRRHDSHRAPSAGDRDVEI